MKREDFKAHERVIWIFQLKGKKMKTIGILKSMIPSLNAVRGAGNFNPVIGGFVGDLTEQVRKAANDDLIVVAPLIGALKDLESAKEFEEQQKALVLSVEFADTLLSQIADGSIPRLDRPISTVADLVEAIRKDVTSIQDVFRPASATLDRIRTNAAELCTIVDAEVAAGERDEEHAMLSARIFDAADRMPDADHATRERDGSTITREITKIAA